MIFSKITCRLFSAMLVSFLLVGCGPEYQTTYSFTPPHSWAGKQCINRCLSHQSSCQMNCRSQDQWCHRDAQMSAMPVFRAYLRRHKKDGIPTLRTIDDFADYSTCNEQCGCPATYRECYSNCNGQVFATTQCVAYCKKPAN